MGAQVSVVAEVKPIICVQGAARKAVDDRSSREVPSPVEAETMHLLSNRWWENPVQRFHTDSDNGILSQGGI